LRGAGAAPLVSSGIIATRTQSFVRHALGVPHPAPYERKHREQHSRPRERLLLGTNLGTRVLGAPRGAALPL